MMENKEKTTDNGTALKAPVPISGPRVYCGPSVRGVARQYTTYINGIPEALQEFMEAHPGAKALLVPPERFAQTRKRLETPGTAEAILYQKIKAEG